MKESTRIAVTNLLTDYLDAMKEWDQEVRDDRQSLVDALQNAILTDIVDVNDSSFENISELISKHGDGDSLTNDEYFLLADYWMNLYNIVKVCPRIFGKGFFASVINECDEFKKCKHNRLNKIAGLVDHS